MKDKLEPHLLAVSLIIIILTVIGGESVYRYRQNHRRSDPAVPVCLAFQSEGRSAEEKAQKTIRSSRPTREEIEREIEAVFGEEADLFKRIAWCESRFDPDADNGSDTGVFQINRVHQIAPRWLRNYKINILVAKELFDRQGTLPWRSSWKCWRRKR